MSSRKDPATPIVYAVVLPRGIKHRLIAQAAAHGMSPSQYVEALVKADKVFQK